MAAAESKEEGEGEGGEREAFVMWMVREEELI